jgi:hypothetical protein
MTPKTRETRKTHLYRTLALTLPALALAGALTFMSAQALPASAAEMPAAGQVLALEGTEHLWVVDEQGVAHLAADPQTLNGRVVDWSQREDVTLPELQSISRGTPWLSAALVRIGDAIYVPQFGAPGQAPTLLHVKSGQDLTLLGVDAGNYASLVLDQAAWESRYGYATAGLSYDDFRLDGTPAVGPQLPPPSTISDEGSSATA